MKNKDWECDECPAGFSRWENCKRHLDNESSHWDWWQCQFCHNDDLWFKSKTEARKHFLFNPRSSPKDKRSEKVYSCVVMEKELKKRREEYRQKLVDEAVEQMARMEQKWAEMPEEWKEKERELLRQERIDEVKTRIAQTFPNRSIEFKEARLKEQIEKINRNPLITDSDLRMAKKMMKKYGHEFLNCEPLQFLNKQKARGSKRSKPGVQQALPSAGRVVLQDWHEILTED